MIRSVRERAGLSVGDTVPQFYTNASESLNCMLKDKVHHSKSGLNAFVDHMVEFVKQQDNELKRYVELATYGYTVAIGTWRKVKKNGYK